MSDNNQGNKDDYEVVFGDDSEGHKSEITDYQDVDFSSGGYSVASDAKDARADGNFDDQDDVFLPEDEYKPSPKKSSSVLSALVLMAVLGAGGYVIYSNPDIITKIKNNFSSTESASFTPPAELQAVSGLAGIGTEPVVSPPETTQVGIPPNNMPDGLPTTSVVPPAQVSSPATPPVAVMPENVVAVPEATAPASVAGSPDVANPNPDLALNSAKSLEPDVSAPVAPADVVPAITPPLSLPASPSPADNAAPTVENVSPVSPKVVAETSAVEPPVTSVDSMPPTPKVDDAKDASVLASETVAKAKVPETKASESLPVTPKPVVKKEDVFSKGAAPVVVQSEDEKKAIASAKTNVYFDAPKGKMLKELPAPSLDAKRGKNESIIVVTKPLKSTPKKSEKYSSSQSSASKSYRDDRSDYTPVPNVTVENNALDSRVTAASRALKLGRFDAAQEMYDTLYNLNPRDGRVLMGRAVLFQRMGQTDRAISAYEELLNVDPDNAEAIVNLAGLVRKEHPAVALSKLIDMRQAHPNNPYVTAQLGVAYADSGNAEEALKYLGLAANLQPDNPKHYFNMAVVADRAGNIQKAVQYYEHALEVDAMYGDGRSISREKIYDRLSVLRGN